MITRAFAPAKVNLSLSVGPPMADARHPLQSIVTFADVGDAVAATASDRLTLHLDGPFAANLSDEPENLVLSAARLLCEHGGIGNRGAALTLYKALPIASGLGGGSSDAAAAFKVLNVLWGLRASKEDLERLAAGIGADGPVCVRAKPALMTGTGETFSPLDMPDLDAVLVNPLVPAPTGAVYRAFDALGLGHGFEANSTPMAPWPSARALLDELARLSNDLTRPAIQVAPAIEDVLRRLTQDPRTLLARLSGSGATVVAMVEGAAAARALAQDLQAEARGWWVRSARLGAVDVSVHEG
ncbi:MAG: 4-(cytidine 5'-diphospho)-2-C-methyl-D-erythritol kinase [Caulobacterales bacterium]|jgi:4-diphosphocytidyl-2-C-methyl-D-erythritol kinase